MNKINKFNKWMVTDIETIHMKIMEITKELEFNIRIISIIIETL